MERALKHKFTVGETVYFTASNIARPAATGTYEVIRLLPTDGDDCQYRIKNSTEAFERVLNQHRTRRAVPVYASPNGRIRGNISTRQRNNRA